VLCVKLLPGLQPHTHRLRTADPTTSSPFPSLFLSSRFIDYEREYELDYEQSYS